MIILKPLNCYRTFIAGGLLLFVHTLNAQTNTFPATGNVGIETTMPSTLLHINDIIPWGGTTSNYSYSGQDALGLYIEQARTGNMQSSIRIQSSKSSDFSNYSKIKIYVFNDGYKLRSLSEVAHFIKENKHLPDIPSAKEVKEKGINVGDNQALLLKKLKN